LLLGLNGAPTYSAANKEPIKLHSAIQQSIND